MTAVTGQQGATCDTDHGGVRQLTTLRGWRDFVAEHPAVPQLLPDDAWRSLGEDDRFRYDEARLAHHAKLLVVATPTIQQVIIEGRRLQYLNRHADVGRCGLILSGPARTGKTTCLTQLGKPSRRCTAGGIRTPPGTSRSSTSPPRRRRPRG